MVKEVRDLIDGVYNPNGAKDDLKAAQAAAQVEALSEKDLGKRVKLLEKQMLEHARNLEFEKAARVRDQLALLREQAFGANVRRPHRAVPRPVADSGRESEPRGLRSATRGPGRRTRPVRRAACLTATVRGDARRRTASSLADGDAGVELAPGDDAARRAVDQHRAQASAAPGSAG